MKKKRVGIITILKVDNYGAELQAYATQKALQQMGYDAEIIDYLFYKNPRHIHTQGSQPVFQMSAKKKLAEFLYPKISKLKQILQHNNDAKTRAARFAKFHEDNTRFSAEFRTYEDLQKNCPEYDAYIVGSDQVWNPGTYSSLDPYFLKFVPAGKRKLSYASSFGVGKLPPDTIGYYKEALSQLDSIAVREKNAVDLVKGASGRDAQWVLDPTLLLDKDAWMSVANCIPDVPEQYVLLYELTPCPYLKTLAKHIAEKRQAKVVRITKDAARMEKDGEIINITDAGPSEFLGLFANADFVVSNSFHGTAFSINFNRDFYVVTPSRKQNNSRQQSLLKLFGLSNRLLKEGDHYPECCNISINYSCVNKALNLQRTASYSFLKNSIDGK